MTQLVSATLNADGSTNEFEVLLTGRASDTTTITVFAQGDFGSGTAALQFSLDGGGGGTWSTVTDGTTAGELTANGAFRHVSTPATGGIIKYRVNLSGSTSPDLRIIVTQAR